MCNPPRVVSDKPKKPKQIEPGEKSKFAPISITIDDALLAKIKDRAEALGLNVSQYLRALAAQDVAARGDLVLRETPPPYGEKKKPDEDQK
jgi:hypothetical protein